MTPKKRIGEMLLEAGIIDETQLKAALGHQRQWGVRLGQALVDLKLATEADIVRALSLKYGFEVAKLDALEPYGHEQAVKLFPREFTVRNNVFPMWADTANVTVAMSDPTNLAIVDEIRFRTGRRVKVCIGGDREVADSVKRFYPGDGAVEAIALDLDADPGIEGEAMFDPFGGGSKDALEAFFGGASDAAAVEPAAAPQPVAPPQPAPAAAATAPRAPARTAASLPVQPAPAAKQANAPAPTPAKAPPRAAPARPTAAAKPAAAAAKPAPAAAKPEHPAAPAAVGQRAAPGAAPHLAAPGAQRPAPGAAPYAAAPSPAAAAVRPAPQPAPAAKPSPAARRAVELELEELPGAAAALGLPEPDGAMELTPFDEVPQSEPILASDLAPYEEMVEGPQPTRDLTDEEMAILESLDRLASGAPAEPDIVKPAQAMAALIRLLIRRRIVSEQDFLDELSKK